MVIVHMFEHVVDALEVAQKLNIPVTLQSAPDAIHYAGALYLLHMFEQAHKHFPEVSARFIVDCGDTGAEAVAAMQVGHKHLRSHANPELLEKLTDIAGQHGVQVHTQPYESLDLLNVQDCKTACEKWLR